RLRSRTATARRDLRGGRDVPPPRARRRRHRGRHRARHPAARRGARRAELPQPRRRARLRRRQHLHRVPRQVGRRPARRTDRRRQARRKRAGDRRDRGDAARVARRVGELRAFPVTAPVIVRPLHVVVPADIDDPARPSGGNAYDRRVCHALPAAGRAVHEIAVAGAWPEPDAADRAELDRRLAEVPDGADVLLDGLVGCAAPDALAPHARRLRLVVLVHLPLGDEAGLPPAVAADRTARERATPRLATADVATSAWTARRLAAVHGVPADGVHVVPPGVEPAPLAATEEAGTRLLCVGSITPTKGQDLLVEALAAVADRGWTCRLVGPVVR